LVLVRAILALDIVPFVCHSGTMQLNLYTETLREHLAIAAEAGGDESRALADRLTATLESATRLVLLDALSAAADEITRELAPGSVEVRLRGGDPEFVVTPAAGVETFDQTPAIPVAPIVDGEDGGTSRLNLRLPEGLKTRIEEAARNEGLSLNAWLVRAAAAALTPEQRPSHRNPSGGERYTGWVR
jgi:hypothetical protein